MANGKSTTNIFKIDDATVLQFMKEMVEKLTAHFGSIQQAYIEPVLGVHVPISGFELPTSGVGEYNIQQAFCRVKISSQVEITVTFRRQLSADDTDTRFVASEQFDQVSLTSGNNSEYWVNHYHVLMDVQGLISKLNAPGLTSPYDLTAPTDILRGLLQSASAANIQMIDRLNESVDAMVSRRAELEAQALAAEAEREQAHKAAIDALDAERKKLQLQSHMSERRGLSKSIKDLMQSDRFTTGRRQSAVFAMLVFIAYMAIGAAGGMGTYLTFRAMNDTGTSAVETALVKSLAEKVAPGASAEQPSTPPKDSDWTSGAADTPAADTAPVTSVTAAPVQEDPMMRWFLIVKFVLSTLITLAGFTAAAAWMKRYYDEEMRLSREMIAFVADVERASWVIEAIHEVKHEAKGELPKEWIDAVTRNLFSGVQHNAQLDDNALALRALMGIAGSAKVGPNGLEVDIGRKGAKALGEAG